MKVLTRRWKVVAVNRSISQEEFNKLLSAHRALVSMIGREVEWYANGAETLIATIAYDHLHASWTYVVLRRELHGNYHVCTIMRHMYNVNAARTDLMYALKAAQNHKHDVIPHHD